jgi:hypothetical protein
MYHGGGAGAGDPAAVQGVRFVEGLPIRGSSVCIAVYIYPAIGIAAVVLTTAE